MEKEIKFRLSTELKEKIEKEAKVLNLSVSSYIRYRLSQQEINKN